MFTCILCQERGTKRNLFIENEPLCDFHYITYLEFLIKDMDEPATEDSSNKACASLGITLNPETKKPEPIKEVDIPSFSMGM